MSRLTHPKAALVAASVVAASLLLSGCGSLIAGGGSNASAGAKSFTYWSSWSEGEPQQKVLAKAIKEFTADTGITVDVQWVGRDNFKKLSPTLNAATTPTDLVDGAQRNIKSVMLDTGSAADMSSVYATKVDGEDKTIDEVIPKRYTDLIESKGKPWMVPYEVASSAFWYNKATNSEVAANPPQTWDELISALQASKDAGQPPLALDGDIAAYNLYYFAELAVRELGPGGLNKAAGDKSGESFRSAGMLKAAQHVEELVQKGFFAPGYASSKFPALQQEFAAGKTGYLYNGSWIPSETASYIAPGFDFGSFPMPRTQAGGDDSAEAYLIGFAIPKKAAHASAAEKFIAYFLNKDRLTPIATEAQNLTPRSDIAAPAALTDVKKALDASPTLHGQFDGVVDDYSDWTTKVLQPLDNDLIFGKRSAASFIDELAKQTKAYWATNG